MTFDPLAVDEAQATAWHLFCVDMEFVEVHHGSILDVLSTSSDPSGFKCHA
jgi:hypothetical protein